MGSTYFPFAHSLGCPVETPSIVRNVTKLRVQDLFSGPSEHEQPEPGDGLRFASITFHP